LTVKRTKSNDLYDLFKPPLVTSALFVIFVIIMLLLNIRLSFTFSGQEYVLFFSLPGYVIANVAFAFLGVGVSEMIYRVKTYGLFNIQNDKIG